MIIHPNFIGLEPLPPVPHTSGPLTNPTQAECTGCARYRRVIKAVEEAAEGLERQAKDQIRRRNPEAAAMTHRVAAQYRKHADAYREAWTAHEQHHPHKDGRWVAGSAHSEQPAEPGNESKSR
ncbi:hypothetical protein FHS39_003783 [Streptomyces olivoverticillatus]|uniref:Uncharacterized protein n=1 Tax=Streptomyces olivoverticillatus TaxID=66427 RepID=A0A7W7PND9_9ACTN|nr:hypothetical protein [Streptomyces olivoverticillatus]MBB4894725.1 hypothetical protein [Streptomyces olivoverticillatus]